MFDRELKLLKNYMLNKFGYIYLSLSIFSSVGFLLYDSCVSIFILFIFPQVSNKTTYHETICLCTHLTSFGGEMVVPPNTIDFKNVWAKFKNLNENAAVFSTVVSLLGIYVILLIWARHMDKKDIVKVTLLFFVYFSSI